MTAALGLSSIEMINKNQINWLTKKHKFPEMYADDVIKA